MTEMPSSSPWHAGLSRWLGAVSKDLSARALFICLIVALAVSLVEGLECPILFDFLTSEEARFQDQLFTLVRLPEQERSVVAERQDVVLVSVDQLSARHLG